MVETLEHLISQAAGYPRLSRAALYKELLRSPTFLLNVGTPIRGREVTRVTQPEEAFDIWADEDPDLGGVWIPVFVARDTVAQYVQVRGLKAPADKEFLWMEQTPGRVFSLLKGVNCFAGLKLYLDARSAVALSWSEVKTLSEGRIPDDGPEIYDLPIETLAVPGGTRLAFGKARTGGFKARLLCFPEAGHFKADDIRKLVRVDMGERGIAWIPCRHFLQVLKYLKLKDKGDMGRYCEELLDSMISFHMYGEAEALCERLAQRGQEAFAWVYLAAIYHQTGRFEACAKLCEESRTRYAEESAFWLYSVRALIGLDRKAEASLILKSALERFPHEVPLLQMRELDLV